ncbi:MULTISPECIES: hypothetical protein [Methylorubrum]|uniref:hypothetical protein n=1 Tax=Methylorubrum TaxID=2282523 RepID=UPI00209D6B01|nr:MULTISPECIES: hypothetical protein [Methylorubrum]MCP1547598.1 hypothetical protein [Methylorubrum zatmanii]MCP1555786.1 hypothetical protein [Methylorubrum extorquens]MCP1577901.1 hypothetical protein [Methylorubrum extorquens]
MSAVFSLPESKNESPIASFEFVKYKYFFNRLGLDSSASSPRDHSAISWVIGAVPLVLLLFSVGYVVTGILWPLVLQRCLDPSAGPEHCSGGVGAASRWAWAFCAAFAGGYVFMLRSFYRAINNFDLSPLSFAGACNNLLVGLVGAQVFLFALILPVTDAVGIESVSIASTVVLSFAIGYLPEAATRTLLWRSDLGSFKRENNDIYKSALTTPIEIIDGIDTEIRDRLADYHIRSTQNLAAANPLMLFVETPFGVYQIMDWVAQAQLCCSVGPQALTKLWPLGIRTLFDLERVALDPACYDPRLLQMIGAILLNSSESAQAGAGPRPSSLDNATIVCNIVVRLDDPHVHRLRQIYIRVGERLGGDSRRFASSNRTTTSGATPKEP